MIVGPCCSPTWLSVCFSVIVDLYYSSPTLMLCLQKFEVAFISSAPRLNAVVIIDLAYIIAIA